jgi:glycosyltransferase involved in cell wall biosynthesis
VPSNSVNTNEPPLVSVVVPAHNAEPFIGELLLSLLTQSYPHFEVLVFDDGSTDATASIVSQYASDRRIRLYGSKENIGVNKATSNLLSQIRGGYWAHPGADDVLESDFIARRIELLERYPKAVMVHGAGHYIDNHGDTVFSPYPALEIPDTLSNERALSVLLQHNIVNTPSVLIRTDATRKIIPYFETNWRYAQDWYLWMLLISTGGDLLYDNKKLHRYRIHGGSLTNDPSKSVNKRIETRLVPLCGLGTCATFSAQAAKLWEKWRDSLYNLYLMRACRLRLAGTRPDASLLQAASAYSGQTTNKASLSRELVLRGFGLWRTLASEKLAKRHQRFPVSGLAEIDDPLFN